MDPTLFVIVVLLAIYLASSAATHLAFHPVQLIVIVAIVVSLVKLLRGGTP